MSTVTPQSTASTLITNIGELSTQDYADGAPAAVLKDAAVVFEGERISWIGAAAHAPAADSAVDAGGRAGLPGWVDSHTHLVFAGDRSAEFEARMAGESYAAGGIAVTTAATREASDYDLTRLLLARVAEAAAGGTTYLETKTGYGLSVEEERRHARIASTVADTVTFLGAHLVPHGADPDEYTELVCTDMLAAVRPYVQWADVFCEKGAFTEEQSRRVLAACRDAGLGLRAHGNQLGHGAGVQLAVEFGAASVDHVNYLSDGDVDALAGTWSGWSGGTGAGAEGAGVGAGAAAGVGGPGTVATCLPACDLSTRAPLADARRLLDAGVPVALASNCNPGTSYTSSMNFCVATAVLQMRLTVQEAVRAATYGGALALRVNRGTDRDGQRAVGSLAVGHRADLQLLNAPSAAHLAYRPGMPLTGTVWRAGVRVR
ncbi:amidohydrolase family protein [Arthrobacter citreus]|uniref:Imidazolonepropionase n=1 Tax=Arthrobacter citreus TaxID=1670 RepID=A0ABZ2ZQX4_9MICC